MDQETWLKINTFTCPHGLGRLSPEQCERNRNRKSLGEGDWSGDAFKPFACESCKEWKQLCEQVKQRREKEAMTEKKIVCSECGKEAPNHGRGLCAACYRRLRKEGRLPPPLSESKQKAKECQASTKVVLSFSEVPELLEALKEKAKEEVRMVSEQIIWELKKAILLRSESHEKQRRA